MNSFRVMITTLGVAFVAILAISVNWVRNGHEEMFRDSLPLGSKITEFHSEKPLLLGDYIVAAKLKMSDEQCATFAMNLGLSKRSSNTVDPMVASEVRDWFVKTSRNDTIYFRNGERFQVWLFYDGTYGYYCDRGW